MGTGVKSIVTVISFGQEFSLLDGAPRMTNLAEQVRASCYVNRSALNSP
jgi:hypothetical protein